MTITPPEPPTDDRPTGPPPEDPAALEAWKERFTDELTDDVVAGEWGGIGWDWRRSG